METAPFRQHATAPNVHVLEPVVLFTPKDPLCFLSNAASVGHIWVNRLNTFTSLNKRFNKALLFCPTTKSLTKTSLNDLPYLLGVNDEMSLAECSR